MVQGSCECSRPYPTALLAIMAEVQPRQSSALLSRHQNPVVRFISQFNASLDGSPDATNVYVKYYVPYSIQTPLLAQGAIHTAACLLGETGHIDRTVAFSHKGRTIALLNEHLRSQPSTTDEAVAGVVQLITNEFYWGDMDDLHAHLRGLKEMIRMRGGFRNIGLHGVISKLAISSDIAIALATEAAPFLQDGPEFEFRENSVPLRLSLNTPFVSTLVPFSACAEALRLHPTTASVLDDMRFLIATVLKLPSHPTPTEVQKVQTTSAWIHDRINSLPSRAPTLAVVPRSSRSHAPGFAEPEDRENEREYYMEQTRGSGPGRLQMTALPESTQEPQDFLYEAVRRAALLYSRAVMLRQPFRLIVDEEEFLELWTTVWYISLAKWKTVLGIFHWVMVLLVPSACNTSHARLVKSMLTTSMLQIGLENWEVASGAMDSAVQLQQWLQTSTAMEEAGQSASRASELDSSYGEDHSATSSRGGRGKGKETVSGSF
ncbi:hypothetical protein GQ53DRAFT_775682 [Thozetella sp. PMI_491]|nr:hypothetical protein GQ53DRAFT_775682 [Thozetella sp. PMI_491]